MASSSNPYEHYNSPQVEDDLIDPDDGKSFYTLEMGLVISLPQLALKRKEFGQLTLCPSKHR